MPAESLIIGVDLAPIRPIPRAITFQGDITTDACSAALRAHLKTWKADTVLHDGAPNVGTAWVQDAFSQAELVLQALKLATKILAEDGTFVTKIFRSKDYNPLLWVFNQLFAKVEATKPPSSRNVSAEIFVVCRGFKAPKKLDPKLLDPRSVFAELANPAPDNEAKVFNPEKKKRKRGGYGDGEYTQFKEAPASSFIEATDPISILASFTKLTFQQTPDRDILLEALNQSPSTTVEIRHCCDDLKVLGRKEFRTLLRWRLNLREKFGYVTDNHPPKSHDDGLVQIALMEDEPGLQQELQLLSEAQDARRKREKRRENARKQRQIFRMQMHMLAPTDIGLEQNGPNGEDQLFAPSAMKYLKTDEYVRYHGLSLPTASTPINSIHDGCPDSSIGTEQDGSGDDDDESSNGDRLDSELDLMYTQYQARRANMDMKYQARKARQMHDNDWEGLSNNNVTENENCSYNYNNSDSESSSFVKGLQNSATLTQRARLFFDQEDLKHVIGEPSDASQTHTVNTDEQALPVARLESASNIGQRAAMYRANLSNNSRPRIQANDFSKTHKLTTTPREDENAGPMKKPAITNTPQAKRRRIDDELPENNNSISPSKYPVISFPVYVDTNSIRH